MSYVSKACDIISERALGSRHCCKHTGDGGKQMVQQLINFCCCLTDPKSFICDDSDQALYQNHSHSGDNLLTTLIYLSWIESNQENLILFLCMTKLLWKIS